MNNKCINDMLTDTRKLSDEDYRAFKSAVRTIQNVLNPFLKKRQL